MAINRLPGVYYTEILSYDIASTEGVKIPVFIGPTNNVGIPEHDVDGTQIKRYSSVKEAAQSTKEGGMVEYNEKGELDHANYLYDVVKDFFEENAPVNANDLSVPHIYVVDVGTGMDPVAWNNALELCKTKGVDVEVYAGLSSLSSPSSINIFLEHISAGLIKYASNLMLRTAFYCLDSDAYEDLIEETKKYKKYSRIGFVEPRLFGKTIARICCTPYYLEPGYLPYRSIKSSDGFPLRDSKDELELQKHGVIFNHVEKTTTDLYVKINLCVATSFANEIRPADSLFHVRYNADHLLKKIFDACYPQIKANETATNIAYLQVQIDKIVDREVARGNMKPANGNNGTMIKVGEALEDPYALVLSGRIHPINSSIAIDVAVELRARDGEV